MNISVGGQSCGTSGPSVAAVVSSGRLSWTSTYSRSGSTPIQSVALQFDCTTATTDISGTVAYNIVPTDPSSGYYVFGQQGELTGFGNDNYLVYLDGALYYNLNAPIVGMAPTPDGGGYWMVGSDGGVYASGDARFYGSTGQPAPEQAGRGHGGDARRQGLLVRGLRRRDLRLRRRPVLRLDREHPPEPADRRHGGDAGRAWLLAGGLRRRDLRLRRRPVLRLDRESPPEQAGGRHGPDAGRGWLLVRGLRRRDLRLRRRPVLRLDREHPPERAHRRHDAHARTEGATGSWPPTAASSTTATPASTAALAGSASPMSQG